ncbi:hypothetical protein FOS14_09545 [Skermania sp. ID1734]|uniref:hypothetical protein n=1 Tax=Skermania sp. ID1734 TaxID=2597516 RepID=UPI00117DEF7F|nr:hypothetical protein [Skermania sp. ID1734]TSE00050.1 hypothetical protein FOS14_09545 [Skermania sp. ID1734]
MRKRRSLKSAGVIVALVLVAGCSSETINGSPEPASVPVTVVTPSVTPTTTPTTTPSTTESTTTAPPSTSTSPTATSAAEPTTVDPREYQQGSSYFFKSPTGNIKCGILANGEYRTGCQLDHVDVVPGGTANCGAGAKEQVAAVISGVRAHLVCLSHSVFVGANGGRVLAYGQSITARGTTCTSTPAGVRCEQSGHGFEVSTDNQSTF